MMIYIVIGLIVLFFSLKIGVRVHYYYVLRRIFKDGFIHSKEVMLKGIHYKLLYIPCSKQTQIRINSYLFIELITPRQHNPQLISVNLKEPTLVITSPVVTKLRRVINENEEIFLNDLEQVFNSYVIPFDQLQSFKESLL